MASDLHSNGLDGGTGRHVGRHPIERNAVTCTNTPGWEAGCDGVT
jgi:hypothetical protein